MIRLTQASNGENIMVNEKEIFNIIDRKEKGSEIFFINVQGSAIVKETIDEIEDMILRDQFAMSAMNATISAGWDYQSNSDMSEDAYKMADAMLKQRKEK